MNVGSLGNDPGLFFPFESSDFPPKPVAQLSIRPDPVGAILKLKNFRQTGAHHTPHRCKRCNASPYDQSRNAHECIDLAAPGFDTPRHVYFELFKVSRYTPNTKFSLVNFYPEKYSKLEAIGLKKIPTLSAKVAHQMR
ncbi:hypothetical protein POX_a00991 [Penicillium oxalicum]|uniref:hypothetical protein n=1 Tax=Penicillium oxalicum TaxID=69781 RepID=UPI0020B7C467|nr:hypothetical protein POX_a00991 [Penicillium oxalicum]KAI2794392.1 hypothetical protein POX_a00991 [Penicillium oxalicum]